jgi:hypothetical protein
MVWLSPKLDNLVVNKLYLHEAEGDREDSSRCPGAVHCAGGWLGGGSTLGIAFRSGQSGLQSRIHTLPPDPSISRRVGGSPALIPTTPGDRTSQNVQLFFLNYTRLLEVQ